MTNNVTELTQEYLKSLLHYDPETGLFTRTKSINNQIKGVVAGYLKPDGYVRIGINRNKYSSHRLAWFYFYGVWPKEIDHINQNPSDNRICNLRECTHSQNLANVGLLSNNTSGLRGVYWQKQKERWRAQIKIKQKSFHLGLFTCKYEAARAYNEKALEFFGKFAYQNIIPTE